MRPAKYAPHTCIHCGVRSETINGAWLRWKRERASLGLRALARRSGVSAAYLSDIERGHRRVTDRVERLYRPVIGDLS